jgi:hypothetical protein
VTRNIRIPLDCAIGLIVLGVAGLAVLTLTPALRSKIPNSLTGAIGGPHGGARQNLRSDRSKCAHCPIAGGRDRGHDGIALGPRER